MKYRKRYRMKKTKAFISSLLCLSLCASSVLSFAQGEESENLMGTNGKAVQVKFESLLSSTYAMAQKKSDFIVENNILVKYNGNDKNVNIPDNLNIEIIGEEAFVQNKNMVSLTIPKGVTEIKNSALFECKNLNSIKIPDTVMKIGEFAFAFTALTKVQLPQNLIEIGAGAFADCRKLESIIIPKGITKIESYTFSNCYELKNVTLPYGLKSIGEEAFKTCGNLKSIIIPETTTYISASSFWYTDTKIMGFKGSYAEEFAKDAYSYPYTGEGPRPENVLFIPQSFASVNTSAVIDGKKITFTVYNINGNNYFKLRDIAYALKDTSKQFEIEWKDNKINLLSRKAYKSVGSELSKEKSVTKQVASVSKMTIALDDKPVDIKAYNLGGNNYFKLRDLGKALDYAVDWDGKTMIVDTSKSYNK